MDGVVLPPGCDQKHEQIDPDALYKSFVLRVCDQHLNFSFTNGISLHITTYTDTLDLCAGHGGKESQLATSESIT